MVFYRHQFGKFWWAWSDPFIKIMNWQTLTFFGKITVFCSSIFSTSISPSFEIWDSSSHFLDKFTNCFQNWTYIISHREIWFQYSKLPLMDPQNPSIYIWRMFSNLRKFQIYLQQEIMFVDLNHALQLLLLFSKIFSF